jgi:hypothetical protein|tara:strand:+ start:375 stop:857 length:483 start_codon:yes stop_codon:yes gene_type:complete
MRILKTFNNFTEGLTDEEADEITRLIHAGQKYIHIHGNTIAVSSISGIFREDRDEGDHQVGKLHDGTTVVRQFGQWFCQSGDRDEKGYYEIKPDPHYYPEVAMDKVPSVGKYDREYATLTAAERMELMTGGESTDRYLNEQKPSSMKQLIESRKAKYGDE